MGILMKVAEYGNGEKRQLKYYADLSAQRISPALLPGSEKAVLQSLREKKVRNITLIQCSPQKRAVQTARIAKKQFPDAKVAIDTNLNEIRFSLDELDAATYSSTKARQKFLDDFISDRLLETRATIKARAKKALEKGDKDCILMVTHTFFMKVVEAFAKNPDLFENPGKLGTGFTVNKRLMEYCGMLKLRNGVIVKL